MFVSADFDQTPPELDWRTVPVPEGGELKGWLAALPLGVWVHWAGSDKPCLSRLTRGKLSCPWCPRRPRGKFYVPIIEKTTRKQQVVLVPKTSWEKLKFIIVGMELLFRRGKGDTSPCRVTTDLTTESQLDETGKRIGRSGRDVRRYLLHLWQIRELTEFYGEVFRPSAASDGQQIDAQADDFSTLPLRAASGLDPSRTSG